MYEFTLTGTWVVVVGYLLLYRRYSLSWLSPVVTGFVLVTLMIDVLVLYTPVVPLRDALQSPWLVIHVVAAIIATGAFTLGGMCSALYLVKERWQREAGAGAAGGRLPRAAARARRARPDGLPHARVRVPDLDLRGADRRPDLGALRLGPLLGLGPQGGVGVHHLGGVRRLPARARHRPAGRAARPPSSPWSAWRRCGSTSWGSTSSSAAAASTPTPLPSRPRSSARWNRALSRLARLGGLLVARVPGAPALPSSSRRKSSSSSGPTGRAGSAWPPLPPPPAASVEQPEERVDHRREQREEDHEAEHGSSVNGRRLRSA